jgi:membrane associated rhomboid family serine protease/Zn-finger nucleic acid-binding protein
MLLCPNCRKPLRRMQNPQGWYFGCRICGGFALGLPVLRKVVNSQAIRNSWGTVVSGGGDEGRPCPVCARPMREISPDPNCNLRIDVCRACQFFWFDAGELEDMPPAPVQLPKSDPIRELPQAAREAIAIQQVRLIAEKAQLEDPAPDSAWKVVPAIFGMPVELDSDSPARPPLLTWSIAFLMTCATLFALADPERFFAMFGMVPSSLFRFGGITMVSSFFLHAGLFHLVGNLYFLLVFGDNVEDFLGRWHTGWLILLATLAGDIAHAFLDPASEIPVVGASGGISGLICFYALQFPRARLGFLWRFYWYFRWLQVPAWGALILWVGLQALGVLEQISGFSNVSAAAHLGGAAVGLCFWWRYGLGDQNRTRDASSNATVAA